ncbi:MAG: YncE family protein [Chlorobi bacterium]|nr:YncE family protein [Chlorobiota bacterium]
MHLATKKSLFLTFISITLILAVSSCTLTENPDEALKKENNYYETKDVSNILNGTCAASGCHAESNPVNGFSTEIQPQIMLGASNRPLEGVRNYGYGGDDVIPYSVEKSLLMQFINGNIVEKLSYNHSSILSTNQITTIKNWIADGAQDYKGDVPYFLPESYRVYVCNQNSEDISVVDGTNKVVSYLNDVYDPLTEFDTPYWVSEYGDYYYVTLSSAGQLIKFRKTDNSPVLSISGLSEPGIIKINSDGTKAYVSRASTTEFTYSSIYVIDLTNMFIQKEINLPISGLPHGMALDKQRGFLFVADAVNNLIHVINIFSDQLIDSRFDLVNDYYPLFLGISPDGNYLYITANKTNQLLVANAGSRSVISKINLLSNPMGVTVSSTGQKIYVASGGGNAVEVITKTAAFWDKTNTITHPAFSMPFGIDITSDDRYVYVTNQNLEGDFVPAYQVKGEEFISTVGIINTQTETVEKVIEVEENAGGIAVEKL